jgi:KaiC/GvpD/RAD55 family RecA-like ATPase
MRITLKKNKALKLSIPSFTCDDNPLGEHLNEYDMLSNLNCFGFTCLIGKPGSGKTSIVISWLTGKGKNKVFRKIFDNIILCMPESSRNSLKKNIFENHDPTKMFEELTIDSINNIYNMLLKNSKEKEKTLLILDDVGASLKRNDIQTILKKIIFNRRHLKVHIIVMLQSFTTAPLVIRKLYTNVIMFKPSKKEFETLFEELFETKKDNAIEIMNFVYDRPHQYLFLNVDSQRMYKNFDEVIVNKNVDEN